jgi:hypothetical protein
MTNWIKTSERQPTVKDVYLVAYQFLDFIAYDTCRWAPNLHEVDEYDFPEDICNHSGFYEYDSEYGYYERKPLAWQPIEDYIEE